MIGTVFLFLTLLPIINILGLYLGFYNRLLTGNILLILSSSMFLGSVIYTKFIFWVINLICFYEMYKIKKNGINKYCSKISHKFISNLNTLGLVLFNVLPIIGFAIFPVNYLKNILILQIISDTSQYLGGKYFNIFNLGKLPSSLSNSPNKTWDGYISGGIFTLIISLLFNLFNLGNSILYIITGIAGGQLASMIKRNNLIKDFGKILGNHGGFLDRFDSLQFNISLITILKFLKLIF